MRLRERLYTLACQLPPSPQRNEILMLLGEEEYRERTRVAYAQAALDLTPQKIRRERPKGPVAVQGREHTSNRPGLRAVNGR